MDLSAMELWLWFGFGGMAIGSAIILYLAGKMRKSDNYHALIALLVTAIATISYFALARGTASIVVGGDTIYIGRYLDWLFTTPLLLISLMVIALPASKNMAAMQARTKLMLTVVVADILMIVTGFLADLSSNALDTAIWYLASCLWFIVVLGLMFTVVRRNAYVTGLNNGKLYTTLLSYLTILWAVYPIVWLLGTTGTGTFSLTTEVAAYAILDVSAKAVFGIAVVSSILKLERFAQPDEGETTVKAA